MPRISAFYRIKIYMYYRDHAPPYFHAFYGGDEAVFDIGSGAMSEGSIPRRARRLVEEWIGIHRLALQHNWALATANQPLAEIPPLD